MNHQLTPNPAACQSLSDTEAARLRRQRPDLWADPAKSCLTCLGKKTFLTREGDHLVTYDCNCLEQWRLHRWLLASGVDTHYQRLSWSDVTTVDRGALDAALSYMDHAQGNVSAGLGLTFGSPDKGTGKTLLSTLVFKALLHDGYDGYFTQFNAMLDMFTSSWRDEDERRWYNRKIRNAGVLVIDDIGRENKGRSQMVEAMLDEVVRSRVGAARPTIISSNFTVEELNQGYGSNVLSLLSESNQYINVPGVDYRPTMAQRKAQDVLEGIRRPLVVG